MRKFLRILDKIGWTLLSLSFVILIWHFIATYSSVSKVMPGPLEVGKYFFRSIYKPIGSHSIIGHTLYSLRRVAIGYSLAAVCGVTLGVVMGMSRYAKAIINPIFELFRPIPPIAWIPIGILWFGIGESVKYFIIFLAGFFTITVNSYAGTRGTDPVLIGAAKMLGANKARIFYKIILPSALPQIFAGLQVALSTCWMAVLAAEMVRSSEGAGWIITVGSDNGNTVQILVGMIAIGLVGLLIAELMQALERRLCSWNMKEN